MDQHLRIGATKTSDGELKAVYPPEYASRRLALGNIWFWFENWDFSLVLGGLYLFCSLLMLSWRGYGEPILGIDFYGRFGHQLSVLSPTPIFWGIVVTLTLLIVKTSDIRKRVRKFLIGTVHSACHLLIILFGTALITTGLSYTSYERMVLGEVFYLLFLALGTALLGFVGGFIWGLYLVLVSYIWGDEANSSFSAMRLNSYKNFMRLKIEKDKLTIYPIGIDKVPQRAGWKMNPELNNETPSQDTPAVIPVDPLGQHFIERPIEIEMARISSLSGASEP